MPQLDFPTTPSAGQVYSASNGVDYTWNATVGVWTAAATTPSAPLSVTSGSIAGSTTVGSVLTYATGTATGGTAPYTYTWDWMRESDNALLASNTPTYTLTGAEAGTRVFVTLTATDSVAATASANTAGYPAAPSVITPAPFPNSSFSPSGGPNASPASVNTGTLFGTATCSSWADGSTSLTSTGDIQFQVNGGGYSTGPTPVTTGDTVDVIWDPAAIAAAADNATLTGTLTDGTYTNTYSITVTRGAVTGLSGLTNLTGQTLSTAVTSATVTPGGFNVPISIGFTGTATDPLTSLGVSVQGGAFNTSPQTVDPGQTIQMQGTTGAANGTAYGVDVSMGSPAVSQTWTATTVAGGLVVSTPSILTPANDANNVGTVAGITITSSAYSASAGVGAHNCTDWEVYKAIQGDGAAVISVTNNLNYTTNIGVGGNGGTIAYSAPAGVPTWTYKNTTPSNTSCTWKPVMPAGTITSLTWTGPGALQTLFGNIVGIVFTLTPGSTGVITNVYVNGVAFVPKVLSKTLKVDNSAGWLGQVAVGDVLTGNGGQTLTVASKVNASATVTSTESGFTGNWTSTTIITNPYRNLVSAPTTDPPSSTKFQSVASVTCSTTDLTSLPIAKPPLEAVTTYFAKVQYNSTDLVASDWSNWSKFTTGNL